MRKIALSVGLAVSALAFALAPLAVQGAEFIVPNKDSGGNVTVSQGETHRNLYLAASNITVNSAVTGDLFVGGGTVILNGDVEQDLNAGGGNVVVNSKVGGDARVGGGSVNINGPISGDLLVAGGSVVLGDKATVGGDLIVCGGDVTVNGAVSGSLRANGGRITLNSVVTGPVTVRASESLVFGAGAQANNTVTFYGPKQAVVQNGAQVSQINYQMWEKRTARRTLAGLFTAVFLFKLIAFLTAALLLMRFLKRPSVRVVNHILQSPWANLGVGALSLIVLPLVAIILVVTFVGSYVGLIVGLFFILALVLSALLAALFVGSWVVKALMKKPSLVLDWQGALIGSVLLGVVWFIPVVGALFDFVMLAMAFGAAMRLAWQWLKQQGNMPEAM